MQQIWPGSVLFTSSLPRRRRRRIIRVCSQFPVWTLTTAAISAAQHAEAACVPISLQLWDLRWDPGLHSCHSPPVTNSFFVLENISNPLKVTVFWVSKSSCQLRVLLLSLYNDDNTWIATSKRRMKNISSLPFYVLPWVFVRKIIFLWQKFKSVEYFIA